MRASLAVKRSCWSSKAFTYEKESFIKSVRFYTYKTWWGLFKWCGKRKRKVTTESKFNHTTHAHVGLATFYWAANFHLWLCELLRCISVNDQHSCTWHLGTFHCRFTVSPFLADNIKKIFNAGVWSSASHEIDVFWHRKKIGRNWDSGFWDFLWQGRKQGRFNLSVVSFWKNDRDCTTVDGLSLFS